MSLRLVHLSDLHLGFRAFDGTERGWNRRERDVSSAFHRVIQEAARVEPRMVLITGDLFHRPDPPSTAFLTLTRGLRTLQSLLPEVSVLIIAGERDTPLTPADPGPVAVLDTLPGIEAAAGAPRAVRFRSTGVHALLVPHRAVQGPPQPELRPDRDARFNLLLLRGRLDPGPRHVALDPAEWDYVALGGSHVAGEPHPRMHIAGSLERIGWDPWGQATEEKGFVVFDLEEGRGEFHPIRTRPVVDLAPIRCDPVSVEAGTRRLRHLLEGIPGGIEGKLVRTRLDGELVVPEEGVEAGLLEAMRKWAAHLEIRVTDPADAAVAEVEGAEPPLLPLSWHEGGVPSSFRPGDEVSSGVPLASLWGGEGLYLIMEEGGSGGERLLDAVAGSVAVDGPGAAPAARAVADLLWRGGSTFDLVGAWAHIAARGESTGAEAVPDLEGLSGPEEVPLPAGARTAGDGEGPASTEAGWSEPAGPSIQELQVALRTCREDWIEAEGEAEVRILQWAGDRQEAETRLQYYRDQARRLKRRISALDVPGAHCPTCSRPLAGVRDRLRSRLQEEWETVVQDGKWWKRRRAQLEDRPEELRELETRALRLRSRMDRLGQELQRRSTVGGDEARGESHAVGRGNPDQTDGDDAGRIRADGAGPGRGIASGVPRPWSMDARGIRPLLRRAGNHLRRWSEGRLSGLKLEGGEGLRVMDGMTPRPPTPGELPGLEMILQLALWEEGWSRRRPVPAGLLLRGLDERGMDPLLPLLDGLPLERLVVVVLLPRGAPPSGAGRIRGRLVPGRDARSRPVHRAQGPVGVRLTGAPDGGTCISS